MIVVDKGRFYRDYRREQLRFVFRKVRKNARRAGGHGGDIAKAQNCLGHANPATTRLYDKRKDRPEEIPTFRVMY